MGIPVFAWKVTYNYNCGHFKPRKHFVFKITEWIEKISALLLKSDLPKISKSKILSGGSAPRLEGLKDGFKYPGAKILSVIQTGQLGSNSLVFPHAVGVIKISLHFKKTTSVCYI